MTARAISLQELLRGRADAGAAGDIVVRGLALDSRRVRTGDAFVALAGLHAHGIAYAPAAAAHGAAVILAETVPADAVPAAPGFDVAAAAPRKREEAGVPIVWIDGLSGALGPIASRFFDEPSRALRVIGVTGTNGKTSVVQLLAQALRRSGHRVATIGTLGAGVDGELRDVERTTPDAIAVHGLLAEFRADGAAYVAMEVSSHALEQGRVNGVAFELAVFTNLTRDHLDYHGTMHAYGAAKQRLFAWPDLAAAIVNVDDAFGRALLSTVPPAVARLRYGIERDDAEVVALELESTVAGQRFRLRTPWGEAAVTTPLLGRFNVSNLLAVAACLGRVGLPIDEIASTLAALEPVAGRMSRLGGAGAQPLVVVDYAHTPDALEQALTSLRAHCAGRLICVFGCGGERDAGKRPLMGAIAEALADRVVVTDDNPRGEDGDAIVAQILAGLARPDAALVERDRAAAIARAIGAAGPGYVVLIAGKGHEPYQEIAGAKRPFDDLATARGALERGPC
ncbi:MAG TPA: UDP-N-acetylmuramoyl-L-alanyl-D-glutamate--2,6-diaminopimelate ligase [Dokdonella sp.]